MAITILCDSASDLSTETLKKYTIDQISLRVTIDNEEFEDGRTISPKQVYDKMRNGHAPKTSQPSPQTFRDTFIPLVKDEQSFIYFAVSSELSGTYQTAKMVKEDIKDEYPNATFEVVDTKAASLGCGLVVMKAAELANDGYSFEEILTVGRNYASHMEHIFTVDDLEYLYRGGRISRAGAFMGSLLKVKPLIHIEQGKLVPLEKIRGSKKVLKRMIAFMNERCHNTKNQRIGISHGDDLETAEKIADMIQSEFETGPIHIEMIGSAIGAHTGPGTMALFFLNDSYQ